MEYSKFEEIISCHRLHRYMIACNHNTRKTMTLYRYNIRLSQALLAVVGCFEVALRNKIDMHFLDQNGSDWLRNLILPGGPFSSDSKVARTKNIIEKVYSGLVSKNTYSHAKLLSEMEFGVWKYMFSNPQYKLTGQNLLSIFTKRPNSAKGVQLDNSFIFNELNFINNLRNRIAHHEPICFGTGTLRNSIDISYAMNRYNRILTLLQWLDIDSKALLYGLDDVIKICNKINAL